MVYLKYAGKVKKLLNEYKREIVSMLIFSASRHKDELYMLLLFTEKLFFFNNYKYSVQWLG